MEQRVEDAHEVYQGKAERFLDVCVQDTGLGIKQINQEQLFEMPMMLDPSSNRKGVGIGLGLVIADAIVSSFEGKLSFVSRESFGSTFNLTFKLDRERSAVSEQISQLEKIEH